MNTFILEAMQRGVEVTFVPVPDEDFIGVKMTRRNLYEVRISVSAHITPHELKTCPHVCISHCMNTLSANFPKPKL